MPYADQAVTICSDVASLLGDAFDWSTPETLPTAPGEWSQEGTTYTRDYLVEYALYDLNGLLRCSIIPGSYDAEWISRRLRQETYGIDIVLLYKTATRDGRDLAMQTMETLIQVLEENTLVNSPARWIGVERPTMFDSDRLDEENVFAAASRHSYLILREKGVAV